MIWDDELQPTMLKDGEKIRKHIMEYSRTVERQIKKYLHPPGIEPIAAPQNQASYEETLSKNEKQIMESAGRIQKRHKQATSNENSTPQMRPNAQSLDVGGRTSPSGKVAPECTKELLPQGVSDHGGRTRSG